MPDATFSHGDVTAINHVAGANLIPGQIVARGNTTGLTNGIAPVAITNTALGSLHVGGVWKVKVASNYARDTKVYWDFANSVLTTTNTHSLFGYTLEAAAAANAIVRVLHRPFA